MHEKLIREINGEIADALLARKLPFAPSRKAALALLKDGGAGADAAHPGAAGVRPCA